jgi:hypothetical protein
MKEEENGCDVKLVKVVLCVVLFFGGVCSERS